MEHCVFPFTGLGRWFILEEWFIYSKIQFFIPCFVEWWLRKECANINIFCILEDTVFFVLRGKITL